MTNMGTCGWQGNDDLGGVGGVSSQCENALKNDVIVSKTVVSSRVESNG